MGDTAFPKIWRRTLGYHKPRPLLDKGENLRPLHCTHHPHKPRPPTRWHQLRIQLFKHSSLPHHLILPWTLLSQLQLLSTNVIMKMFLITPGLRPNRKKIELGNDRYWFCLVFSYRQLNKDVASVKPFGIFDTSMKLVLLHDSCRFLCVRR